MISIGANPLGITRRKSYADYTTLNSLPRMELKYAIDSELRATTVTTLRCCLEKSAP
jgi:hypothetical protein